MPFSKALRRHTKEPHPEDAFLAAFASAYTSRDPHITWRGSYFDLKK